MKHNLKQALATAALLLCSMVAMAQTTATVDGITYEFMTKAKLATVVKSEGGSYSGNIVIPEIVGYDGVAYSVTAIGNNAFEYCGSLTGVAIPKSVTTIGVAAFSCCGSLTSINIPDGITTIERVAFSDCSRLTSIAIPNSVTTIGSGAFSGCSSLTSIIIPEGITTIAENTFDYCSSLTSVTIPNSVTAIGNRAFGVCENLTSITIPNSVTTIGAGAFCGNGLTNVTIPNSVTTIGDQAFQSCYNLSSITIGNSVTTIGWAAFSNCSSLKSVIIPNSVTTIRNTTFYDCTSLTSVTIGNGVTTIEGMAFNGCTGLTSVTIPNSVTTIGDYAFRNCSGLTSVTIGNKVTTIEGYAFENCVSLETVVIGESVKTINARAFANCGNLADVYCYATSVPSTNSTAFNNSYIEYATLHVPEESIDSYKSTEPWSSFGTKTPFEGELPDGPQTPVTPKCATPVITYSAGKLNIACDTEGAQFVTTITDSDIRTHYDSTIELTVTYNITTYATLAGYENSDTIQASLCWIDSTPTMEQIGTDISEIASTPVLVRSSNGNIFVSGATEGTAIRIYSADGMNVGSAVSSEGETAIPTTLQKGKIAIVAIGNSRIKMVVR